MLADVPLKRIDSNPWQTRPIDAEHARSLADDIRANGLLQPPVARIMRLGLYLVDPAVYGGVLSTLGDEPDARVQLALGHHRLAAYRLLAAEDEERWGRLPLDVRQLDSYQMALAAWSENEKRRDTNALERAKAIERMSHDFGWTQTAIAEKLGISRPVVSNSLRLLTLPAEVQQRIAAGELSERQAMALVPMFDLPQATLNAYEKGGYAWPKPADVLKSAGERSSDMLRHDVAQVIEKATNPVDGRWSGHAFEDRYMKATICDACPETVKTSNGLRCPHKSCFKRKAAAWAELRSAAASAASGIPIAPAEVGWGEYDSLTNVPHPLKIVADGCPNLRLRYVDRIGSAMFAVDGFTDVEIICLHGKDGKCTCGRAAKAAATRADPDHQAEMAAKKRIDEEIIEPTVAAVLAGLECEHVGVWRSMVAALSFSNRIHDDDDLPTLKQKLARELAFKSTYEWSDKTNFGQAKEVFEKRLLALGLPAPWATTPLENVKRHWARISGWIEGRRWWQYDYELNTEALQGNSDNLAQLLADVSQIEPSEETLNLTRQIRLAKATLVDLLSLSARFVISPGQRRSNPRRVCEALLTREVGGIEFEKTLATAQAAELRYALLLSDSAGRTLAIVARLAEVETEPAGEAIPGL
jgi:ParB/RepB/Spo0J family partition protein